MNFLSRFFSPAKRQDRVVREGAPLVLAMPDDDLGFFFIRSLEEGQNPESVDTIRDKYRALVEHTQLRTSGDWLKLGEVVTEDRIKAFEDANGLMLPDDYRAFLGKIGEGASGPWCQMTTLADSLHSDLDYPENGRLDASLPFNAEAAGELNRLDSLGLGREEVSEQQDKLWEHLKSGFMHVANFGCGIFIGVILVGSERGNLWVFDGSASRVFPIAVKNDPDSRVGILEWFDSWLTYQLQQLSVN